MGIFEIIVAVCLIIVMCVFCSIYFSGIFVDAAMAYLFDLFKSISQIIEKRKHKKIIKKLKEEAEYGKICADILRNKIIESKKEEKNDRN